MLDYQERPHEGLAFYTPADVFHGRIDTVHALRQAALERHWSAHPERYPNGPPVAKRPPAVVSINPDTEISTETVMASDTTAMSYPYETAAVAAAANVV